MGTITMNIQQSTDRILTTHVGSLPRPKDLLDLMKAKIAGLGHDRAAYATRVRSAVAECVRKQAEAGIDILTDGEQSKPARNSFTPPAPRFTLSIGLFLMQDSCCRSTIRFLPTFSLIRHSALLSAKNGRRCSSKRSTEACVAFLRRRCAFIRVTASMKDRVSTTQPLRT